MNPHLVQTFSPIGIALMPIAFIWNKVLLLLIHSSDYFFSHRICIKWMNSWHELSRLMPLCGGVGPKARRDGGWDKGSLMRGPRSRLGCSSYNLTLESSHALRDWSWGRLGPSICANELSLWPRQSVVSVYETRRGRTLWGMDNILWGIQFTKETTWYLGLRRWNQGLG